MHAEAEFEPAPDGGGDHQKARSPRRTLARPSSVTNQVLPSAWRVMRGRRTMHALGSLSSFAVPLVVSDRAQQVEDASLRTGRSRILT